MIQKGQPLFLLVWLGSALVLIAAAVMGLWSLSGADRLLLVLAALVYLFGVQLPTMTINIPLNNRLQRLDAGTLDAAARRRARADFEPRWNRWNALRTVCASLATMLLLLLTVGAG